MNHRTWTLAEIHQLCGLPAETLRYVLDTRVVPWLRARKVAASFQHGRGAPRTFARRDAVGLAIAAQMLRGGLQRALVMECLQTLYYAPDERRSARNNESLTRALLGGRASRIRSVGVRRQVATLLEQALKRPEIVAIDVSYPGNVRLVSSPRDDLRRDPWMLAQVHGPSRAALSPAVRIRVEVASLREALDQ